MKGIFKKVELHSYLDFLGCEDDSIVLGLEPLLGILLVETVGSSNTASLATPLGNILAGTSEHNVEVHTVDTNAGIVPEVI